MSAAPVVPRRILLVGGGGREHALAWRLAGEPGVDEVVVAPGSAGIATLSGVRVDADVEAANPGAVVTAASRHAADLVVVGPEAPLAAGVADALVAAGILVFGPVAAAARIESSKAFCHEVAAAAGIPMARAGAFAALAPALAFAAGLAAERATGWWSRRTASRPARGWPSAPRRPRRRPRSRRSSGRRTTRRGTTRRGTTRRRTTRRGCRGSSSRNASAGPEASVIALCDGRDAVALPAARDHKRLNDGDAGPNTGGMGAYSPLPDLDDAAVADILARFHRPALAELARRGIAFRGALYAGLILTADRGPVLLEFNARFGDPETQAILPRLASPLAPLLLASARGDLAGVVGAAGVRSHVVPAVAGAAVAIVLASRGYPASASSGDAIGGLGAAASSGALVFHAGTRRRAAARGHEMDGEWETDGGRVLAVVGRGPDLRGARAAAEAAADLVSFAGLQRRRDIAAQVPDRGLGLARSHVEATP